MMKKKAIIHVLTWILGIGLILLVQYLCTEHDIDGGIQLISGGFMGIILSGILQFQIINMIYD